MKTYESSIELKAIENEILNIQIRLELHIDNLAKEVIKKTDADEFGYWNGGWNFLLKENMILNHPSSNKYNYIYDQMLEIPEYHELCDIFEGDLGFMFKLV